jgi:hypothetical protein
MDKQEQKQPWPPSFFLSHQLQVNKESELSELSLESELSELSLESELSLGDLLFRVLVLAFDEIDA